MGLPKLKTFVGHREDATAFVESPTDAVLGLDSNGTITSWNPGAEVLLGYPAAEIVGKHIRPLVPPLRLAEELAMLAQVSRGTSVDHFSTMRVCKDKKVIEVSITLSPIKDVTGRITGATQIVRKQNNGDRLENAVLQKEKALGNLQVSEVRYRRLFEAARDGILLLHVDTGQITDVNPFLGELLGMHRDEFIGKSLWELGALRHIIANKEAFLELKDKGYIRYEHLPLKTKTGKEVHVEFVSNVYVAGGETVIQCNIRDITERYHIEQALREAEEHIRQSQKIEAFGQLAAGVAHDFNNLLTVINGYSELVLTKLGKEDPHHASLEEISKAGQRAALLTRQLLAFSRKQILDPKVLDLGKVAAEMEKLLRRVIGEDIELVNATSPDLWPVRVDPGQMEQIILNLAVNSRDAMPQGGKLTITTTNVEVDEKFVGLHPSIKSGPHVLLSISDTGCGMDKETQSHLFEPFYTTKGPGKGTGLGLATVYGIVKQSEGSVWVHSEIGEGTTIKIYLPRVKDEFEASTPVKTELDTPKGTETILLVEDEPSVRKLVRHILEKQGYSVLEASTGALALKVIEKHAGEIHLLLSDVVMPGMNGAELAAKLVKIRPQVKTLFLSGYSSEAIARHGHLNKDTSFLQKPFLESELAIKVRFVLDKK